VIVAAVIAGVGALLLVGWTLWELQHAPLCVCNRPECGGGCWQANTDHAS